MIYSLTGIGITAFSTVETEESFTELVFTSYSVSFLTDVLIRMRYVEIGGQLRRILVVIKMRGFAHSRDIREYETTPKGIVIGERLTGFNRLTTGTPTDGDGS